MLAALFWLCFCCRMVISVLRLLLVAPPRIGPWSVSMLNAIAFRKMYIFCDYCVCSVNAILKRCFFPR